MSQYQRTAPTTQGAVERTVRTIKEGIDAIILAQEGDEAPIDWPSLVNACIFTANANERFAGVTPFEDMLGRKPVDPFRAAFGLVERNDARDSDEYTKKLQVRLEEIHAFWKSKSHEIKCRAADQELGSTEELEPDDLCVRISYISGRRIVRGTVKVLEKIGSNTYRIIRDDGATELCHGYQLIKVRYHPDRRHPHPLNGNIGDRDESEYFEIEKFLDYDPIRGYLVKWKDYDHAHNSWQRPSDMPHAFRKQMSKKRSEWKSRTNDTVILKKRK
jgi:hypothetical protein